MYRIDVLMIFFQLQYSFLFFFHIEESTECPPSKAKPYRLKLRKMLVNSPGVEKLDKLFIFVESIDLPMKFEKRWSSYSFKNKVYTEYIFLFSFFTPSTAASESKEPCDLSCSEPCDQNYSEPCDLNHSEPCSQI